MTTTVARQPTPVVKLQAENAELRRRLEEAEETIRAIQQGVVDAFVVEERSGHRVYTLEAADRPYRLFVEQMHEGAATLHADGTIVYCNRRLADLLKMPQEKLMGAALHEFIAPEDRPIYDNLLWQGETRAGWAEARLRRADGGRVPAYMTFNTLPEDCGAAIGVLITDLTAQRHHEQLTAAHQTLRESEECFRSIFNQTIAGIAQTDLRGRFTQVNERYCEIVGRSADDLSGLRMQDITHPDDLPRNLDLFLPLVHGIGQPFVIEKRYVRPDGSAVWVNNNVSLIRDGYGQPEYVVAVSLDITDRKRAEDGRQAMQKALEEADRRKDEFLAILAHELRNPLAPIRNAAQLLRLKGGDDRTIEAASKMIERQTEQMVRMVDELLDVSRINQGKIDLKREGVDLASVVNHAVEAVRPSCESKGIELTVMLPVEPVCVYADPMRLGQVVNNLLNNARKFTEWDGRIGLMVDLASGTHNPPSEVLIRVRDTGIGIAADQLTRIFDLFMQIDTSLERSGSGLGIGLTLVKNLVEMHGGTVEAHSAGVGQGSEFVVRLPILLETAKPPQLEPTGSERATPIRRRILVVDDNLDSAASLAILLDLDGNETHTAHDGLEALEAAATFRPDVILLDIGLPKLNGFEVARKIREQPWSKGMVLVALTGWGQEEDRSRSADAGFDYHMVKPVDYAALMKLLASMSLSLQAG